MFGFPAFDLPLPRRRLERSSIEPLKINPRRPPERGPRRTSRSAVRGSNVIAAPSRRRVDDAMSVRHKLEFDVERLRAPISAFLADRVARPLVATAAKATAADRRLYHPVQHPAATIYGTPAKFGVAALEVRNQLHDVLRFHRALSVLPCVQRAVRREVIFAFKKQGAHHVKRRQGPFSKIRC